MTDRLARFTPAGPDAGELLFRMGRASVPTLRWKLAVAALLLMNATALAWIALRPEPAVPPAVVVPVVVPVPLPVTEPSAGYHATEHARYGAPRVFDDPDRWPAVEPLAGVAPPDPPLTPLAGRRGEID